MVRATKKINYLQKRVEVLQTQLTNAKSLRRIAENHLETKQRVLDNERLRKLEAMSTITSMKESRKASVKQISDLVLEVKRLRAGKKLAEKSMDNLRKQVANQIQEKLDHQKIPAGIRNYVEAAKNDENIGWVRVEHNWTVITYIAGIATEEKRYATYALEEQHLKALITNDSLTRRVCSASWMPSGASNEAVGEGNELDLGPEVEEVAVL